MKTAWLAALLTFGFVLTGCTFAAVEEPERSQPTTNDLSSQSTKIAPAPSEPVTVAESCSLAGHQQQIDDAFAAYQADRSADEDAVLALADWTSRVSAEIATSCNASTADLSDPEELTDLLDQLMAGGNIIYVRHTHTDRSRGDEDVSLGRCDKQRILSDRGREEALLIRQAYEQLDLPVSEIVSTQYCRTLETAVLAFGVPQVMLRSDLQATLSERLATRPEPGTNTLIVAHIGTIRDRVGLDDTFEEGDSLVYRPTEDGGFEYVGRIGLYDWPRLATLNGNR